MVEVTDGHHRFNIVYDDETGADTPLSKLLHQANTRTSNLTCIRLQWHQDSNSDSLDTVSLQGPCGYRDLRYQFERIFEAYLANEFSFIATELGRNQLEISCTVGDRLTNIIRSKTMFAIRIVR
ncbi:hypothetical protein TNCV_313101 [Trichonephila clavipes]|nr:hypothetical protein TNCV_313101 [Trichonephila clavipes]